MTGARPAEAATGDPPLIAPRADRPRWLRRLTVALAVAGVLSLLAGVAVVLRGASTPVATAGSVLGVPTFRVDYSDAPATVFAAYEHGESVGYTIELSNDGPLPITVEDVPITGQQAELHLLHPTEVRVVPRGGTVESAEPFEPFRLGTGETRTVIVSGVFYNCEYYTERAMDLLVSQPVTWSVAGVSSTTDVALTDQLAIRSTFIRECPARVMDRGARTRTGG